MKRIILLTLLIPVLAHAQRYGHTSGSTFYWNKSGEAQKSDSIRYIQGSNITLTQSGNTLTIAGAAGAGSTANVRANTGWTASGTLARDTLYTNYAIFGAKTFGVGGTTQAQNARAKFNVLGRAANDTLAIFSNDGGGVVDDSSTVFFGNGNIGIKGAATTSLQVNTTTTADGAIAGNAFIGNWNDSNSYTVFAHSGFRTTGASYALMQQSSAATFLNAHPGQSINFRIGNVGKGQLNANGKWNFGAENTPDSVITVDGGIHIKTIRGLRLGKWTLKSNEADSLIVYFNGTRRAAIDTLGNYVDLFTGTPPLFIDRPQQPKEHVWLLRIIAFLLVAHLIFKLYEKISLVRSRDRESIRPAEL